ncbi:hypothetical protein DL96DRAFT_1708826 [Flagelloscypha sp. PMI_526]|nr:hypothetical protein DL96DRAFT_1708826 [Flagelloscypha sp. PMI_526]
MSPAITIDPLPRDRTPITTTLPSVSGSTSSSRPSSSHDEIPVAFIVGGIVAGALLALCVCALWILWGKKIQIGEVQSCKRKGEIPSNTSKHPAKFDLPTDLSRCNRSSFKERPFASNLFRYIHITRQARGKWFMWNPNFQAYHDL